MIETMVKMENVQKNFGDLQVLKIQKNGNRIYLISFPLKPDGKTYTLELERWSFKNSHRIVIRSGDNAERTRWFEINTVHSASLSCEISV